MFKREKKIITFKIKIHIYLIPQVPTPHERKLKHNFDTIRQNSCEWNVGLNVEFPRCDNGVLSNRTRTSFLGKDGELFRGEVSWCLHTTFEWLGKGETCKYKESTVV